MDKFGDFDADFGFEGDNLPETNPDLMAPAWGGIHDTATNAAPYMPPQVPAPSSTHSDMQDMFGSAPLPAAVTSTTSSMSSGHGKRRVSPMTNGHTGGGFPSASVTRSLASSMEQEPHENSPLRKWEVQHQLKLDGIQKAEDEARARQREVASEQLKVWYEERKAKLVKTKAVNLEAEKDLLKNRQSAQPPASKASAFGMGFGTTEKKSWERVCDLVDFARLDDTTKKSTAKSEKEKTNPPKDTARMKQLLIHLKHHGFSAESDEGQAAPNGTDCGKMMDDPFLMA